MALLENQRKLFQTIENLQHIVEKQENELEQLRFKLDTKFELEIEVLQLTKEKLLYEIENLERKRVKRLQRKTLE